MRSARWWLLLTLVVAAAMPWARAQAPAPRKDLVYGEVAGTALKLDFYPAEKGEGARPALVMIHGGGWRAGSKDVYAGVAPRFTREGIAVFSVGYRLAPAHRYPAQVDDVQRAVRWIRAKASEFGIDPARIGAMGHSAGGHLAQMLGVRETRDNSDPALASYSSRVQCVVNVFGPTDLTNPHLPATTGSILAGFIGKTRDEAPELYRDASPLTFVDRNSAPTLFCHGTEDPLVPLSQSVLCMEALRRAGVEANIVVVEGAGHGWRDDSPGGAQVNEAILAFLKKHLRP